MTQEGVGNRIFADQQSEVLMAAGGYVRGEVSSFGFPRASGTAFLPALRDVLVSPPWRDKVDGTERFDQVESWVKDALHQGGLLEAT